LLLHIFNETRHQVLAKQVRKADSLFTRLRGLLFRPPLETNQGMLLSPCQAIHCIGMTYAIDAVFVDKNLVVVGLAENLKPGQFSAVYSRAHDCLELPTGVISKTDTQIGDQLLYKEVVEVAAIDP
jgi:uncharacterized protein